MKHPLAGHRFLSTTTALEPRSQGPQHNMLLDCPTQELLTNLNQQNLL